MPHLEALVHISKAYTNCGEKFYLENLCCSGEQILLLQKELGGEQIDQLQTTLIGKFPNAYSFTKTLAEQLIQTKADYLPICVFRPATICCSTTEPVRVWIDNFNAPFSACFDITLGFLHVTLADHSAKASLVPVDYCAKSVLAFAWHTAEQNKKGHLFTSVPPIYNYRR